MMKDADIPVQLALRLKLQNGRIVEVEHLIARNLSAGASRIWRVRAPACSSSCRRHSAIRAPVA